MIKKPKKCCDFGTYDCQIPIPIRGKVQYIDFCIAPIVAALNAGNIITLASCCGHGKTEGDIIIEGDLMLTISKFKEPFKPNLVSVNIYK